MTENPPPPASTATPAQAGLVRPGKLLAVAAFFLALAGFYFCQVPVAWVASLVLATVALVRSARRPQAHGGRGLAVAAILLSLLGLGLRLTWYPSMKTRHDADEAYMMDGVASQLTEVVQAEDSYRSRSGTGRYGTLEELHAAHLVSRRVSETGGTIRAEPKSARAYVRNWKVELRLAPDGASFVLTATPEKTYLDSFYYSSQDRAIRSAAHDGAPAEGTDPVFRTLDPPPLPTPSLPEATPEPAPSPAVSALPASSSPSSSPPPSRSPEPSAKAAPTGTP